MKNAFLYKICGFMAFVAMFITGVIGVLGLFDLSLPTSVQSALTEFSSFMLLISVAISGFVFVMTADLPGPDILWKILFIIFVVLSLTGKIGSLI